jgi:carboxyl-terminal processing protease
LSRPTRAFLVGLAAGVVIAVALLALISPLRDALPTDESRADEARRVIEESYFRPTDADELDDASIDGMVREISRENDDRFSHYFDPATYRRFLASTHGEFSGIGLNVTETKRGLRVARVFEDTPAEEAGLAVGDQIVAVDGDSLAGVSSNAAASRIKGKPGTEVTITVVDGQNGKRRTIDVERAQVRIPAVEARMEQEGGRKIGYVRLGTFSRGAHGELRNEIEELQRDGAEGIVLDLRGNGGGLLDEAVLVTSIFQESGPVVTIEGRSRPEETLDASGDALDPLPPLAVLVDRNTASASEIVTAALEENGLATVIGERTFGKGVFQEVIELEGGGALDLTVGEYLTADGTSILGTGVVPNEKVRDPNGLRGGDAVLDAGLADVLDQLEAR